MRKIWTEYRDFINKGNVVTIAVGLVMALFFKDIVDAIVNGLIMPIVSLITGQASFDDIDFTIADTVFELGLVIRAVIIFLIVGFVLYLIVKLYNRYVAEPEDEAAVETELTLLTEIRDELRAGRGAGGSAPPVPPPTV